MSLGVHAFSGLNLKGEFFFSYESSEKEIRRKCVTKERKLGFKNHESPPSDSWVIPCFWQFSFTSETLSSEFWKIHWGLSWFYSGFIPASLSSCQCKFLFLNHCRTRLLNIVLAGVSPLPKLYSEPISRPHLWLITAALPGALDKLQSYLPQSISERPVSKTQIGSHCLRL